MEKIKKFFDGDVVVSQHFGEHPEVYGRFGLKGHNGIDFKLPIGTRLVPGCQCVVTKDVLTIDTDGYGNHIVAKTKLDNKQYQLIWAHLDSIAVPGKELDSNTVLGLSGNSGSLTDGGQILPAESAAKGAGAHLHFGIREIDDAGRVLNKDNGFDGYIDPVPFLEIFTGGDAGSGKPDPESLAPATKKDLDDADKKKKGDSVEKQGGDLE